MANIKKSRKVALNTNVDVNVKNDFKEICMEFGFPMGSVLERLMCDFANGRVTVTLGKNNADVYTDGAND